MEKKKEVSKEEIAEIGEALRDARSGCLAAWKAAVKSLPANGREYRQICGVGKKIEALLSEFYLELCELGYSAQDADKITGERGCHFD